MTIDKTWGYRKDIQMKDIKTPDYMIEQIVRTSKYTPTLDSDLHSYLL